MESFLMNPSSKDRAELTKQQAIDRFYQVSNLVYFLDFTFQKLASTYQVKTQLNFDYNPIANKSNFLRVEYSGKYLHSLQINDFSIPNNQIKTLWRENFIEIPTENLLPGRNLLIFLTKDEFSTDGTGLFSFIESGFQYIYSLLAPNHCHRMFPCFDQPNLKAHFYLQFNVPSRWVCVTNEDPKHIFEISEENKRWVFEPKVKISTYLLAIITGDFKCYSNSLENCFQRIPLRLFYKQSMTTECENNQKEIFALTNYGLRFYTEYFRLPFPFSKYDQIFCPEFNFLGMENPGAVCLTDSYLFWDSVTSSKRTARCLTILHELAHMWFGNLVTMKWWDDVWLNESFAVFISHYCLEKMKGFDEKLAGLYCNSMVRFFFYKRDGYEEDSISETTHAIAQNVQSTEQSSEIFNSITYSKGAAVIKQLMFMIKEEAFSSSLKSYFEKFKWGNANLSDFVAVIEESVSSGEGEGKEPKGEFSLQEWKMSWFQWASLNLLTVEDRLKSEGVIKIHQQPYSQYHPFLRLHHFKLCVYYRPNSFEPLRSIVKEVRIKDKETNIEFELAAETAEYGILLNFEDFGYFKAGFDQNSQSFFKKYFLEIPDMLSKALVLLGFYDLIYESEQFSAFEFLEIIQEIISNETDLQLFNHSLNYASRVVENFLPEQLKPKASAPIFAVLYDYLKSKSTPFEKILTIQEFICHFAKDEQNIGKMVMWLLGKNPDIKHIGVNSYMLTITIELVFMRRLLTFEERKDLYKKFVENNKYYRLFCEFATIPLEQKQLEFDKFLDPNSSQSSVYLISFAMKGFNNEFDMEGSVIFAAKFFENIEEVFKKCTNQYAKTFFRKLFPRSQRLREHIERIEGILKRKNEEVLEFMLKEKLQSLKQKLRVFNRELKRAGLPEI